MTRMQAGKLDRWVVFNRPSHCTSSEGETYSTYETFGGAWASLTYQATQAAFEREEKEGVRSRQRVAAHIRYREDIQMDWRIGLDGRQWNILSLNPVGRQEGLDIVLETGMDTP